MGVTDGSVRTLQSLPSSNWHRLTRRLLIRSNHNQRSFRELQNELTNFKKKKKLSNSKAVKPVLWERAHDAHCQWRPELRGKEGSCGTRQRAEGYELLPSSTMLPAATLLNQTLCIGQQSHVGSCSAVGGQSTQLGYWSGYDLATRRGTQRTLDTIDVQRPRHVGSSKLFQRHQKILNNMMWMLPEMQRRGCEVHVDYTAVVRNFERVLAQVQKPQLACLLSPGPLWLWLSAFVHFFSVALDCARCSLRSHVSRRSASAADGAARVSGVAGGHGRPGHQHLL